MSRRLTGVLVAGVLSLGALLSGVDHSRTIVTGTPAAEATPTAPQSSWAELLDRWLDPAEDDPWWQCYRRCDNPDQYCPPRMGSLA